MSRRSALLAGALAGLLVSQLPPAPPIHPAKPRLPERAEPSPMNRKQRRAAARRSR